MPYNTYYTSSYSIRYEEGDSYVDYLGVVDIYYGDEALEETIYSAKIQVHYDGIDAFNFRAYTDWPFLDVHYWAVNEDLEWDDMDTRVVLSDPYADYTFYCSFLIVSEEAASFYNTVAKPDFEDGRFRITIVKAHTVNFIKLKFTPSYYPWSGYHLDVGFNISMEDHEHAESKCRVVFENPLFWDAYTYMPIIEGVDSNSYEEASTRTVLDPLGYAESTFLVAFRWLPLFYYVNRIAVDVLDTGLLPYYEPTGYIYTFDTAIIGLEPYIDYDGVNAQTSSVLDIGIVGQWHEYTGEWENYSTRVYISDQPNQIGIIDSGYDDSGTYYYVASPFVDTSFRFTYGLYYNDVSTRILIRRHDEYVYSDYTVSEDRFSISILPQFPDVGSDWYYTESMDIYIPALYVHTEFDTRICTAKPFEDCSYYLATADYTYVDTRTFMAEYLDANYYIISADYTDFNCRSRHAIPYDDYGIRIYGDAPEYNDVSCRIPMEAMTYNDTTFRLKIIARTYYVDAFNIVYIPDYEDVNTRSYIVSPYDDTNTTIKLCHSDDWDFRIPISQPEHIDVNTRPFISPPYEDVSTRLSIVHGDDWSFRTVVAGDSYVEPNFRLKITVLTYYTDTLDVIVGYPYEESNTRAYIDYGRIDATCTFGIDHPFVDATFYIGIYQYDDFNMYIDIVAPFIHTNFRLLFVDPFADANTRCIISEPFEDCATRLTTALPYEDCGLVVKIAGTLNERLPGSFNVVDSTTDERIPGTFTIYEFTSMVLEAYVLTQEERDKHVTVTLDSEQ